MLRSPTAAVFSSYALRRSLLYDLSLPALSNHDLQLGTSEYDHEAVTLSPDLPSQEPGSPSFRHQACVSSPTPLSRLASLPLPTSTRPFSTIPSAHSSFLSRHLSLYLQTLSPCSTTKRYTCETQQYTSGTQQYTSGTQQDTCGVQQFTSVAKQDTSRTKQDTSRAKRYTSGTQQYNFLAKRYTSTDRPPHLLEELWTVPNLLSLSRVVSAPVISWLILEQQWAVAVALLGAAGVTDWLDGAVARHLKKESKIGSYLDPLADKILICSLVCTLSYAGSLPVWLSSLIVGRDMTLIALTFVYRFRMLGWKWPGLFQFFNVDDTSLLKQDEGEMQRVQPIMLSKVNTVLQMGLIGMCISQPWLGWPGGDVKELTEYTVLATTAASGAAYGVMYLRNKLYPRKV